METLEKSQKIIIVDINLMYMYFRRKKINDHRLFANAGLCVWLSFELWPRFMCQSAQMLLGILFMEQILPCIIQH